MTSHEIAQGAPSCCLVCGCNDLWRQKDFSPRLGLLIVALAVLFSTIAIYFYWPVAALAILMGFALLDLLLYLLMPDVLVCYRCGGRHRHFIDDETHPQFNLELAERYRQEAARLDASVAPKSH